MIITIDGPAGSGKSTVAKGLAKELNFTYVDSGAMYRALTYYFLKHDIKAEESSELEKALSHFDYKIKTEAQDKSYFVNGEEVTELIRSPEVTAHVSEVAALPSVRQALVPIQQKCALHHDAVFEGRDMGTVVFPQAEVKIFLTASAEKRAERRYAEMLEKGLVQEGEKASVLENLLKRDHIDSTRETSPLRKAEGAFEVCTDDLTIRGVIQAILDIVSRVEKKTATTENTESS